MAYLCRRTDEGRNIEEIRSIVVDCELQERYTRKPVPAYWIDPEWQQYWKDLRREQMGRNGVENSCQYAFVNFGYCDE
jgi:hypothetical protein